MKYSDLVETGANDTEKQECLVSGDTTAIASRIPKNLRDVGEKSATLKGVSLSAFVRMRMIEELVKKER